MDVVHHLLLAAARVMQVLEVTPGIKPATNSSGTCQQHRCVATSRGNRTQRGSSNLPAAMSSTTSTTCCKHVGKTPRSASPHVHQYKATDNGPPNRSRTWHCLNPRHAPEVCACADPQDPLWCLLVPREPVLLDERSNLAPLADTSTVTQEEASTST